MSFRTDSQLDKAINTYDAVVAFLRWQELRGTLTTDEVTHLLQANKSVYEAYLTSKLTPLNISVALGPSKIASATTHLIDNVEHAYPALATQIRRFGVNHPSHLR